MADSNPFAHLGQGMLGADASIARAAGTPQPIFDKNPMAPITKGLVAAGMDKFGITKFLNSLGGSGSQPEQQPEGAVVPPSVGGTGINPMSMGAVPPGGVGLQNNAPIEGLQPRPYTVQGFGGQTGYSLPTSPYQLNQPSSADETRKQILSSWGS